MSDTVKTDIFSSVGCFIPSDDGGRGGRGCGFVITGGVDVELFEIGGGDGAIKATYTI